MNLCRTDRARARARSQTKEDNTQAGAEETINRRQEHDKDKEMSWDGTRQQFAEAERHST